MPQFRYIACFVRAPSARLPRRNNVAPRNDVRNVPYVHEVRTHQASDIAELWQEFLSLLELIACIGCAVVVARTNAVYDNKCFCCHHRNAV